MIKEFQRKKRKLIEENCNSLYKEYKIECIATNVIQLSYLFENSKEQYNTIKTRIRNSLTKDDFSDIYRDYIGNIHKKLFGKTYNKMTLIPKFEDSDKSVNDLLQCVLKRIDYHLNCREHTINYNVHEHEILRSIYMYRKVKEIQELLNMFIEKYKVMREHVNDVAIKEKQKRVQEKKRLKQEKQRLTQEKQRLNQEQKRLNQEKQRLNQEEQRIEQDQLRIKQEEEQIDREVSDFNNLSLESSEPLSEPFIEINTSKRK